MAVKGFNIGGSINRYDFNSLVNKEGAVTAEMLGSDVTTQLTTMSNNISTLQGQVATLNDGYTQLSDDKADNGVPLKGDLYAVVKRTSGSSGNVVFSNSTSQNRFVGLVLIESNTGANSAYIVAYKNASQAGCFSTQLAGSAASVTVNASTGDVTVGISAWSKAVMICTQTLT